MLYAHLIEVLRPFFDGCSICASERDVIEPHTAAIDAYVGHADESDAADVRVMARNNAGALFLDLKEQAEALKYLAPVEREIPLAVNARCDVPCIDGIVSP